ncbi:hypothetical protein [Pseudonocardia nigra]|uniref:hypothetical protein n=1 Tax=Pseudonocardia nigra TaxID=1921578 RepID=UPI001C5E5186|nr:hypothetical protein [Pseudonocardia nigra]
MLTDSVHPTVPESPQPPAVVELLKRVAAERGLDFEPAPEVVVEALPALARAVERVAERCRDAQERRWLAAALAALAHHVQAGTLPEVPVVQPVDDAHGPG